MFRFVVFVFSSSFSVVSPFAVGRPSTPGSETQEVLTVVAGGVMMSGLGIVAALLLNSHRRNNG